MALMMKAVSKSETSVNLYQTIRRNIPEDCHLHTRRHENLKSHHPRRNLEQMQFGKCSAAIQFRIFHLLASYLETRRLKWAYICVILPAVS
jgi:hypothetical protein